jgi:hypothetical protein
VRGTECRAVREHLEQWLGHARTKIAVKTLECYEEVARLYLIRVLGIPSSRACSRRTSMPIIHSYAGWPSPRRGLSPGRVLNRILRQALQRAVPEWLLARNPAPAVARSPDRYTSM